MKNNENIFDLKDFIYHNSNELQRLSYVKQEALKQISRCRFQIEGEKCIVNIIWEGIKMKLVVTNDISVYDFIQQLWTVSPREMSVNFMLEKLYQFKGDLLNVLEQYKNKYLKSASDFRGEIWIKMYSNFELEHPMRKIYNATWLDYEKQLEQGNIIYDENEVCGIWAMSKSFCHKVFDEKCIEHYGDRVLIVEPIDGELYFNDGPELIGKRYLVKGKYNMRLSHDRALYVEKLMELSNSISNEHNDETSFEINNELANTRMYCRDLEYRLKISKIMKWAFLILGMILGIIINLLV